MNLTDHPELADRLAAAYGLGTLRGGARRRFEAQARRSPALRAAALAWQERFAAMTELQPGEAPSPNVWKRIEIELANQPQTAVATAQPLARKALRWWRGAAFAGGLATAAAVGVVVYLAGEVDQRGSQLAQVDRNRENLARENVQLAAQLQAQPAIQYVAVLSDERAAPSLLVTFEHAHAQARGRLSGGTGEVAAVVGAAAFGQPALPGRVGGGARHQAHGGREPGEAGAGAGRQPRAQRRSAERARPDRAGAVQGRAAAN